jgi:catechol-2,3-dioxygenase
MSGARTKGPSVNHLVLTVRDIETSHRFYTEALGFEQCGELKGELAQSKMWFYRGSPEVHHDFALVEAKDPAGIAPATPWQGFFPDHATGINHVAIGYPTREEWLERLRIIRSLGIDFLIRVNHGMTHSAYISDPDGHGIEVLYEVPAEAWEQDVDAALNYVEMLPNDGEESLQDDTDFHRFPAPTA